MLENIFLTVLNMSITASVAAVCIILFRWVSGNRLPRAFRYFLWTIVLVRLLVPFSFSSVFSIFNTLSLPGMPAAQGIGDNSAGSFIHPAGAEGIAHERAWGNVLVYYASGLLPQPAAEASVDPVQILIFAASFVWLAGTLGLLAFSIFTYIRASHRLNEAVLCKHQEMIRYCSLMLGLNRGVKVYTAENIHTPIVCGLLKPRIILPADLVGGLSDPELRHIITHELVHIKRYDYLIKPLAFLTLCIHWFNPVMWLCFKLSQKDMEMSCDERVLSASSGDIRSEYARSLINIAVRRNGLFDAGLPAFGENNIKSRIKGIMKFKKTKVWIGVAAAIFITVLGLSLLTDGQYVENNGSGVKKGDNLPVNFVEDKVLDNMLMHRSPYIGDASNVGNLLDKLPYGDRKNGISLDTGSKPYGITINYRLESVDKLQNIKSVLLDNALLLFSLIENVDSIKFKIDSAEEYEFQYTRAELQKDFDRDLWSYSGDRRSFGEFLMNISFDILAFPEKYTPIMSSVPGLRIDTSLNAVYYNFGMGRKFSAEDGRLFTWDVDSGKISESQKEITLKNGPVYWSPLNMGDAGDSVTISILDGNGNTVIEKQVSILNDGGFYVVKPSHDVLTDDYYSN